MAVKKAAAKKTAVKKSTAKPVVTRTVGVKPVKAVTSTPDKSVEEVAAEVLKGKWNSGRERDDALRRAGFDPAAVQKEAARQRARGSSWM